jgi:hypothetical protein
MAINRYTNPVQNSLEQYIPLPFSEMAQAGQFIQQRGDIAEQKRNEAEVGLKSAEALAPAYKDFINQFANDYNKESDAILTKSGLNSSDPEYKRSIDKLNLKFLGDPRLKTIAQGNALIKQNDADSSDLRKRGIKFLDPNKNFTGKDQNGNLVAPKGGPEMLHYDDLIHTALTEAASKIEQNGAIKTNKGNLNRGVQELNNQIGTNPDLIKGVQYLTQNGYTQEQAIKSIQSQIHDTANRMLVSDTDYGYLNYQLGLRKQAFEERKAAGQLPPELPFELQHYSKPITPNTNNNVGTTEVKSNLQKILDSGLDDKGNLRTDARTIEDNPENRLKYPNAIKKTFTVSGSGMGYGGSSYNELQIGSYNKDDVNMLKTARQMIGYKTGIGSAKEVFTKYQDMLKQFDQSSNDIISTDNLKINSAIAENVRRQISNGKVYTVDNGNLKLISKDKDIAALSKIDDSDIKGISSKNLGELSGYSQFTDKAGKTYYTPLSEQYQKRFLGSKAIENYTQDFDPKNIEEKTIPLGNGNNQKVFINPNASPINYRFKGVNGTLIPYKSNQNGKIISGGIFQTDKGYGLIPSSEIENNDSNSIMVNIADHNKIQGN